MRISDWSSDVCSSDLRFSGGTSGLSIGHVSPEAAEGGAIGLVEDGDLIKIDIPARTIDLIVSDAELAARRAAMEAKGEAAWRSEERRVGKEWGSKCRSRWSP